MTSWQIRISISVRIIQHNEQEYCVTQIIMMFQTANRCPPLVALDHSTPDTVTTDRDTNITLKCDRGFRFDSGASIVILYCDGTTWSTTRVQCLGENNYRQ